MSGLVEIQPVVLLEKSVFFSFQTDLSFYPSKGGFLSRLVENWLLIMEKQTFRCFD